jgi:hypothetical protein
VIVIVAFTRTWVLLLGMSGLIVLFWFLNNGEVLRFLVSIFRCKNVLWSHSRAFLGAVHRRHVVPLCPLGRNWCGFLIKQQDSGEPYFDL